MTALDEAEAAYTRILEAQPGQYPAVLYLGILRAQRGEWQGAVQSFREAAKRQPREAARQHFAHHAIIIAGGDVGAFNVEGSVMGFHKAAGACDNHAANSMCAHNMRIVIDLDATQFAIYTKGLCECGEQTLLRQLIG